MQTLLKIERFRNRRPSGRRFFCLRPFLVPRWCRVWSIAPVPPLRPAWCLDGARHGVLHPCHLCARSWCLDGAGCGVLHPCHLCDFLAPIPLYYTHYSILQILVFLLRYPLLAARYRLYSISRRSGNCKQM